MKTIVSLLVGSSIHAEQNEEKTVHKLVWFTIVLLVFFGCLLAGWLKNIKNCIGKRHTDNKSLLTLFCSFLKSGILGRCFWCALVTLFFVHCCALCCIVVNAESFVWHQKRRRVQQIMSNASKVSLIDSTMMCLSVCICTCYRTDNQFEEFRDLILQRTSIDRYIHTNI